MVMTLVATIRLSTTQNAALIANALAAVAAAVMMALVATVRFPAPLVTVAVALLPGRGGR